MSLAPHCRSAPRFPPSLNHVSWHGQRPIFLRDHDIEVAAQRRAIRDAQIIVPSAATNMIECLDRDRDAFRHLTSFLTLRELGPLAGSSMRIRRWLLHDGPSCLLSKMLTFRDSDLDTLVHCDWARCRIANLKVLPNTSAHLARDVRSPLFRCAQQILRPALGVVLLSALPRPLAQLWLHQADRMAVDFANRAIWTRYTQSVHRTLLHLPRFERLHDLTWAVTAQLDGTAVRTCFTALGALQQFTVVLPRNSHAAGSRVTIMSHISCMHSLRGLTVTRSFEPSGEDQWRRFAAAHLVDFSGLPHLKFLTRFVFDAAEQGLFFPSPEQCACLARCDALTTLGCGRWDAPEAGSLDEFGQPFVIESEEVFLAQRIGVLAASKGRTVFVFEAADALDREPRVRVQALTDLTMHAGERITPLLWSHLSQFLELRVLSSLSWSALLTEADWLKLSGLTHLERLAISGRDVPLARVLPSLLLCSKLETLMLAFFSLGDDALSSLLHSLPRLTELGLIVAAVPSLKPLHNSALTRLILAQLTNKHGERVCARRMLLGIALPHLVELAIEDHENARLTAADAAEINRSIFDACPLLEALQQNLRDV